MSGSATEADQQEPLEQQWTTSSDPRFVDYYSAQSLGAESVARSRALMERVLHLMNNEDSTRALRVADVGCGPGGQAMLWAQQGHEVHALDISAPLIEIAKQRAEQAEQEIDYRVGSATSLPWNSDSMDVCIVPELLEHVADWRSCLDEFARVLAPGGVLYLSTSNKLCPKQREFSLPLYSWYPGWLKRHYEKLATTTRPELVSHAAYPAVNWFSYFQLQRELRNRGLRGMDRFDFALKTDASGPKRIVFQIFASTSGTRWIGQMATPYTLVVAVKSVEPR